MGSVLANSFAHTTSPVNTQQPRCKRVKFDPCFHVFIKLRWNLNAFLSWYKPGYSWKSVSKMLHLTTSSICTQPSLSSFPLTQLDLTECARNSGILHPSLSSHSSVHKPGPLLCVHTFVPVHFKFISRRRKNNNFTDWISCNYIHKDSTSYIIQSLKCEDPPSYAGSAPRPNSSPLSTPQPPFQIHIPIG